MKNDKTFVWVIGANGMLGHEVVDILKVHEIPCYATDIECDITSIEVIRNYVEDKPITHIVNCAAYTAVDKAEDEPEKAYALNALGPKNISIIAAEIGAILIHISTDYVFDGQSEKVYKENDPVHPLSVYGKTKAEGEAFVQQNIKEYYIVRTAWLYGKYGKNFVYTMLKLMNDRDEISVVSDQHGSPTYAPDLAEFILVLIGEKSQFGIYHYTNDGQTTWFDFAEEIYKLGSKYGLISSDCKVSPVTSDKYPTKAQRPKWSKLNNIRNSYEWRYSLLKFFSEIKNINIYR